MFKTRDPTRFQIMYALAEISFQNTKQFSKHKISFQNTKSVFKAQISFQNTSSSQNTNHRSNTQNQFSNRKYIQLQISKTSFSFSYE